MTVNLNETSWSFSFECPRCGEPIFLEGEIGRGFDLLEVKLEGETVTTAIIRCTKCRGTIRLNGFDLLSRIGCFDES